MFTHVDMLTHFSHRNMLVHSHVDSYTRIHSHMNVLAHGRTCMSTETNVLKRIHTHRSLTREQAHTFTQMNVLTCTCILTQSHTRTCSHPGRHNIIHSQTQSLAHRHAHIHSYTSTHTHEPTDAVSHT